MRTIHRIQALFVAIMATFACISCNHELDEAPYLTYDGVANMTIEDLLALHTVGDSDSYSEIPDGTVISGIITSCDKAGNCYKYLTIQDETGAIMIKIDDANLYPKYQIGQRVFVECGDMVIGDYRKNKQLGFWIDGSMAGIASSQEDLYIFRDGLVGPEPDALVITSANDIDESMYNRLVKLENCHFAAGGSSTFCDPGANTSRNIVMADNSVIVLRTSSYADFANTLLPEGDGDIYGILTIYNTTVQLVIRSYDDVKITQSGSHGQTETCFSLNLQHGQDPFAAANPWTRTSEDWIFYDVPNANPAFGITGEHDSWLISPTFNNLELFEDIYMTLTEERSNNGTFEIYYSTSYSVGSAIDASQWTQFQVGEPLPASVTAHNNFRIAFHYSGVSGSYWVINDMKLTGNRIVNHNL